jgi:hypothetical protein
MFLSSLSCSYRLLRAIPGWFGRWKQQVRNIVDTPVTEWRVGSRPYAKISTQMTYLGLWTRKPYCCLLNIGFLLALPCWRRLRAPLKRWLILSGLNRRCFTVGTSGLDLRLPKLFINPLDLPFVSVGGNDVGNIFSGRCEAVRLQRVHK